MTQSLTRRGGNGMGRHSGSVQLPIVCLCIACGDVPGPVQETPPHWRRASRDLVAQLLPHVYPLVQKRATQARTAPLPVLNAILQSRKGRRMDRLMCVCVHWDRRAIFLTAGPTCQVGNQVRSAEVVKDSTDTYTPIRVSFPEMDQQAPRDATQIPVVGLAGAPNLVTPLTLENVHAYAYAYASHKKRAGHRARAGGRIVVAVPGIVFCGRIVVAVPGIASCGRIVDCICMHVDAGLQRL